VTSQSGTAGAETTEEYKDAWVTMNMLTEKGQLSWSGRESNRTFLNLGGARFADVSGLTGADYLEDGRACARLDWDQDWREDLVLRSRNAPRLRLMLNRWPRPGNWMQFDLVGVQCNRDAVGAQVFAEDGARRARGSVRAGEGFMAVSSKRVHLGLGDAASARVRVRWPGGTVEEFGVLAVNRRWRLVQGNGSAEPVEQQAVAALAASKPPPTVPATGSVTRVPLTQGLPMAPLPLPAWDAPERTVRGLAGKPVLVNFWSSTCGACLEEFELLQRRQAVLARTGLQIVPMLVEEEEASAHARELLAGLGLGIGAGRVDERTRDLLAPIFQETLLDSEDMPLPCSLLLDRAGRLRVLYLGPLRFRELMADVQIVEALSLDERQELRLCGGSILIARLRNFDRLAKRYEELEFPAAAALYRTEHELLQRLMGR
jgi:thiol-disulfide isomerase/thioredoxin